MRTTLQRLDRPAPCPQHRTYRAGCAGCRAYARGWYHLRKNRDWTPPDLSAVGPVRAHVRALLDAGMRLTDVAAAAGIGLGYLNRIMYGSTVKQCSTAIASKICAVTPEPGSAFVDGLGVRRRIRALGRAGWEQRVLAARLGYHQSVGSTWANADRVLRSTHDKVNALYDELSTLDGGSDRAIQWARCRNWDPPEAWSDDTIDDPDAKPYDWCRDRPDEVVVQRAVAGRMRWADLNDAERTETLKRMLRAGMSRNAIVATLHVARGTAQMWMARIEAGERGAA